MPSTNIFGILQAICTVIAIFLNGFLIFVIRRSSKKSAIGNYKYLIMAFAAFEMTYALVVLIGMPINFIADRSWIVFNHDGLIGRTSFNWLGPGLYCTFYELWMGFVCLHFIWRFLSVARMEWMHKIQRSWRLKVFLVFLYMIHFIYAVVCGIYFCTRSIISSDLKTIIHNTFDVEEPDYIGYILLRAKTLEGDWSPGGITSILNHYLLVMISVVIIGYTGVNIWISIRKMQKESVHLKEINLQKQIFATLLIQTTIPFFLCHLPTLIYLIGTSPFISKDFTFGSIASMFSFLTAVPKVLDPIVVMWFITDYRRAALKVFNIEHASSTVGVNSSTGVAKSSAHDVHTIYHIEEHH